MSLADEAPRITARPASDRVPRVDRLGIAPLEGEVEGHGAAHFMFRKRRMNITSKTTTTIFAAALLGLASSRAAAQGWMPAYVGQPVELPAEPYYPGIPAYVPGVPTMPPPLACSAYSAAPVVVWFANYCPETISVEWLDFQCNEIRYADLTPGYQFQVITYVGHHWLLRSSTYGTDIGGVLTVNGPVVFNVCAGYGG